nr:hypothetical protein Iba_chr05fCG10370 [Ipomoea batatas]
MDFRVKHHQLFLSPEILPIRRSRGSISAALRRNQSPLLRNPTAAVNRGRPLPHLLRQVLDKKRIPKRLHHEEHNILVPALRALQSLPNHGEMIVRGLLLLLQPHDLHFQQTTKLALVGVHEIIGSVLGSSTMSYVFFKNGGGPISLSPSNGRGTEPIIISPSPPPPITPGMPKPSSSTRKTIGSSFTAMPSSDIICCTCTSIFGKNKPDPLRGFGFLEMGWCEICEFSRHQTEKSDLERKSLG